MRSYPNRIPLSGARRRPGRRRTWTRFEFDRLYGNFGDVIPTDAAEIVRRSADRHAAWASGDYDHLT